MLIAKILPLAASAIAQAPAMSPGSATGARWVVDWADSECSLIRTASDGHTARAAIVVTPGSPGFVIRLLDAGLGRLPRPLPNVELSVEPAGVVLLRGVLTPFRSGRQVVYGSQSIDDGHLADIAAATVLRVRRNGQNRAAIPMPGARAAITILRRCIDDQLPRWGIDPERHWALRSRPSPVGGAASWFRAFDYPRESILGREQGKTVARLRVRGDGSVGECVVVASSGHRRLDERTCEIHSSRARYEPARDANGNPAEAMAIVSVTWTLP